MLLIESRSYNKNLTKYLPDRYQHIMRMGYPAFMKYNTLPELEKVTRRVLYRVETVFPFTLFTDVIEITDEAVTLIFGLMFRSEQVNHLPIQDILNVQLVTNLFFGSLLFEITGYEHNPPVIKFLPREKAVIANEIISGLILCQKNNVDTLQYQPDELRQYLQNIGSPETVTV
jgi:hypothetical protein